MNFLLKLLLVAVSTLITSTVVAEDIKMSEWLFIHTSETAQIALDGTLVVPVKRDIFAFTDRPNRLYRYLDALEFSSLWQVEGDDGFKTEPPNSVLTWVIGDVVQQLEIRIVNASVVDGSDSVSYELKLKEGVTLPTEMVDISLFVGGVCGGNGMGGGKAVGVLMRCK